MTGNRGNGRMMQQTPQGARRHLSRRQALQASACLVLALALPGCQRTPSAREEGIMPTVEMEPGLHARAAAKAITPALGDKPVWLAGFDNNRPATGIHDDLWVRVLALSLGGQRLVIAACDLIGLFRSDILQIRELLRQRGALPEALIICCTHTHSGPDTLGLWGRNYVTSGVNRGYQAQLRADIAEAIAQAQQEMQPARLRGATGHIQRWLRNSRDPGLLDTHLPCLIAETREGEPIATLASIACHPEVLSRRNQMITSDFPHYFRQKLERDGWGMAIYASADLGGMLTPQVPAPTFEYAQQMGEDWADQVAGVLELAPVLEMDEIRHVAQEIVLPLDNPLLKTARLLGLIHPHVARGVRPLSVETVASLTRLGPLSFLACPGEVLPKLGLALRAMLPGQVPFLIGLANDELGYILPKEDFRRPQSYFNPGSSYEESMSVGPEIGPRLEQAVQEMVEALA